MNINGFHMKPVSYTHLFFFVWTFIFMKQYHYSLRCNGIINLWQHRNYCFSTRECVVTAVGGLKLFSQADLHVPIKTATI